ncbi:MAG: hypothetical protein ACFFAO_12300, partial [Candidatus Hermodarchaeota archaeon]
SDRTTIDNIWYINSKTKIKEEILNLIANSKEEITIIIPKIEDYLKIEQIKSIPKDIKIRLVSSDPHTNSLVKKFKELGNLQFKTLDNENVIALKGDNNHIVISLVKKDSSDILNDIIGIGINYHPLINILSPIIYTTWASAQIEDIKVLEKRPVMTSQPVEPISKQEKAPISSVKQKIKEEIKDLTVDAEKITPSSTISPEVVSPPTEEKLITPQMTGSYVSNIHPKAGDQAGILINTSFNMLLSKLSIIKGEDFSKELEAVADLILEKKGFSVTLHSIRSIIRKYKESKSLLNEDDKIQIFEAIEDWKQRLF